MDPMQKFVTHFRAARYEGLSPEVIATVKITILDTMAAALAGSASEAGRGIARVARRHGGGPPGSTLVLHGGKIAPPMAALGNGVMARCLELDGTHEGGGGHVGVCIVPAALALAESAETPVSGQRLVLGIALGVDMLCRLRMGAGKSKAIGWMAETIAPMSVAAMGSMLLGLSDETMLDAIGVAYASCSGNVQPTVEGAWSLWVPAGMAAANGLLAIDMAREGFRGPRHPLCGEFGLYRLYFRGDYDEAALLGQLGERNEITGVSLKPYPRASIRTTPSRLPSASGGARCEGRPGEAGDGRDEYDGGDPVRFRCDGSAEDRPGDRARGEIQHSVHGGGRHRPAARDPGRVHRGLDPRPSLRELAGRV